MSSIQGLLSTHWDIHKTVWCFENENNNRDGASLQVNRENQAVNGHADSDSR